MTIPVPISTRFGAVSRSKGQQIAARLSYVTGVDLRSERTGERHYNNRDDIFVRHAVGWPSTKPEDLQRLVYAIEDACGRRENAREAQTMIVELPYHEREAEDPVLAQRMDTERRMMLKDGAEWIRNRTGAAVIVGGHRDPLEAEDGRTLQCHGHYVMTRHHSDGQQLGANIGGFDSYGHNRDFTRDFREWAAGRYNKVTEKHGGLQRRTPEGYEAFYARVNKERKAEGLEPLEPLKPRKHEGMAGTAVRRKRAAEEAGKNLKKPITSNPAIDKKLADNDEIAAENTVKRERNEAKLARDRQIKSIRPRLEAHNYLLLLDKMSRDEMRNGTRGIGEYDDTEREMMRVWNQQRGDVKQLVHDWAELAPEAREFLAPQFKQAAVDLSQRAARALDKEIGGIVREQLRGTDRSGRYPYQTPPDRATT